jgi:hypothetical protein
MNKVLENFQSERRKLDDDSSRQTARAEREVVAAEWRRSTQCRGNVPDCGKVSHFVGCNVDDGAAPTCDRLGFLFAQPLSRAAFEAASRIQIGAHQIVFELGRFVQRMHKLLARGKRRGCGH